MNFEGKRCGRIHQCQHLTVAMLKTYEVMVKKLQSEIQNKDFEIRQL